MKEIVDKIVSSFLAIGSNFMEEIMELFRKIIMDSNSILKVKKLRN